jgi:four helix bundle protein
MLKNFRTYILAVDFYRQIQCQKLSSHLKNQLERAASSIALNLAEGYGRTGKADQKRFYVIAMGSLRESQAILDLAIHKDHQLIQKLDILAAHLAKLIKCYP